MEIRSKIPREIPASSGPEESSKQKERVAEDQFVPSPPSSATLRPKAPEPQSHPPLSADSSLVRLLDETGTLPADSRVTQQALNDLLIDHRFSREALSKRNDLNRLSTDLQQASDNQKGRLSVSDLLFRIAEAKTLREQLWQKPELKTIAPNSYLVKLLGDIREVTGDPVFAKKAIARLLTQKGFQVESLSRRSDLSQLQADLKKVSDAHPGEIDLSPLLARINEAIDSRQKRLQALSTNAAAFHDPVREARKVNTNRILDELANARPDTSKIADLVEKGADLPSFMREVDKGGVLQSAAQKGQLKSLNMLLAAGADPNFVSNDKSALDLAILSDQPIIVTKLLEQGANPNRADNSGMTPLHHAASIGSDYIIHALLQNGADPRLKNSAGKTPAQVASSTKIAKLIRNARPKPG